MVFILQNPHSTKVQITQRIRNIVKGDSDLFVPFCLSFVPIDEKPVTATREELFPLPIHTQTPQLTGVTLEHTQSSVLTPMVTF